ncbi:MAG: hypothetical protein ACI82G_003018, partial [Bradymonadia bacterium]
MQSALMIVGRPRAALLLVEGSHTARQLRVEQALTGSRALAKMDEHVRIVVSEAGTVDMSVEELEEFLRASHSRGTAPLVFVSETPGGDVEVALLAKGFASRIRVPDHTSPHALERAVARLQTHRAGRIVRRAQRVVKPAQLLPE